ncbi:MAG: glutamate formimidoyltransferase [bacterium]|nr:glutamate formimidoyltransferase [bacterium]
MALSPDSPLIECVPNFSEGRDTELIRRITDEIEGVDGVKLLDVDPGKATNRTVVTLVGTPDAVIEAAFLAIGKAAELIDMSKHRGEHPRMGATDVCPLVPVANISMEEVVEYARKLAKRVGEELGIPIYLYEHAASTPKRENLATIREGEYEGFPKKILQPEWKPDFGPAEFNAQAGATVIGARDFLVAYNVNLNTTSTRRATAIAFDIREKGRRKRQGERGVGPLVRDEKGKPVWVPGSLKAVKAIGWYIPEYGIAQVSINFTNLQVTPVHVAFEEACKKAEARGVRVTGSELVGLIPLKAVLDAGRYFLRKQERSVGVSEQELIKIAVKSLGLDELYPFDAKKKIIEYQLRSDDDQPLVNMTLKGFADETASESPAPGGGSVAACLGALGVSLGTMVANLSSHKFGWDDRWEEFSDWAAKGQAIKDELVRLVDEDTHAFNRLMAAARLPRGSEAEKKAREEAVEKAGQYAIEVPFQVMRQSLASMEVIKAMASTGLGTSASDVGVGALCARSAMMGAYLNVKINADGVSDKAFVEEKIREGEKIVAEGRRREREILGIVEARIEEGA